MTEEIRALIFLFTVIAVPIYFFLRYAAYLSIKREAKAWVTIWVIVTAMTFLIPNFWIYAFLLIIGLHYYTRNNPTLKISLFFVLLPSIPAATISIPGFGIINYLFDIGHHHILSIVLLGPLLMTKYKGFNPNKAVNLFVLCYFLVTVGINFRDLDITVALRLSVVHAIIMIIPFYAISRSIHKPEDLKKIMYAAIFGIFIQSTLGIAETLKGWHLYNSATASLGTDWGIGGYMSRNNLLRASASLGHPIILGYISAIGLGLFLFFYPTNAPKMRPYFWIAFLCFSGGLITSLSRGPWVGAAVLLFLFIITGRKAVGKFAKVAAASTIVLAILSMSPAGQNFIELIPFVSSDEQNHAVSTISYRQRLLEQSWIVIKRNPFFGSSDYPETPEMQSMIQSEGIIDLVNSYLQIALSTGLIGLGFFLASFGVVLLKLYKLRSTLKSNVKFKDLLLQNRVFIATIIGIMVTIFTVSGIGVTQIYYWSILGLACAYFKVAKKTILEHILEVSNNRPRP